MENYDVVAYIMFGLLALFWAVLIGSSIWAACVRYVTEGDTKPQTLVNYIQPDRYWHSICILACVGYSFVYGILSAGLCALVHHGHGTIIAIVISTLLSGYALLRISRGVYSIGKKLNKHTQDTNAHKKVGMSGEYL